jgi:hypothetical protein
MHRGDDDHHHDGFGAHHHRPHAGPGHNAGRTATQWQTPHRPPGEASPTTSPMPDLDLVEASFVEGFGQTRDVTSFLRLAGIPFVGEDAAGRHYNLLRVEIEDLSDVGAVMPLVGGAGYRYDPLPARFISRRRKLAFAYHDGARTVRLDFAAARGLTERSAASQAFPTPAT